MKKRQNKQKKGRGRKFTENDLINLIHETRIPKSLMKNSPFPPYMLRKLQYNEPQILLQNTLAPFLVREWRMNDVYDPDPLLGGGTVAGFNQMIAIYSQWQVEHFRMKIQVAANENTKPVSFGLVFRDVRPSTIILTLADAQNALEVQPTTGPNIVGESSGQSIYRGGWHKISPQAVLGNPISYFGQANDYGGSGSASPSQVLWVAFIAYIGAGDLTNGVFLNAYMEFTTRFFSLKGILE
jgi:hypothetical protein